MGRNKDITGEDEALWQAAMADVKPMRPHTRKAAPPKPPSEKPAKTAALPAVRVTVPPKAAVATTPQARDLDRSTLQKLERGKMAIEAVLDLHGHTQEEAYVRLNRFLGQCALAGMRCVLVITGKGRAGQGVLKARLPEWAENPGLRPIILKIVPARQNHGGGGAFYVYLRRNRS